MGTAGAAADAAGGTGAGAAAGAAVGAPVGAAAGAAAGAPESDFLQAEATGRNNKRHTARTVERVISSSSVSHCAGLYADRFNLSRRCSEVERLDNLHNPKSHIRRNHEDGLVYESRASREN